MGIGKDIHMWVAFFGGNHGDNAQLITFLF